MRRSGRKFRVEDGGYVEGLGIVMLTYGNQIGVTRRKREGSGQIFRLDVLRDTRKFPT